MPLYTRTLIICSEGVKLSLKSLTWPCEHSLSDGVFDFNLNVYVGLSPTNDNSRGQILGK